MLKITPFSSPGARVGPRVMGLLAAVMVALLAGCSTIRPPSPSVMPAAVASTPFELEAAPVVIEPDARASAGDPRRRAKRAAAPWQPPADAVPRIERIASGHPNAPYAIKGIGYEPVNEDLPMKEVGIASWYGADFHGRPSSTGERFDMQGMSAAHPTMPLPSYAIVRNLDNGRQIIVRVNDRGPFIGNRIIDLSYAAAKKLGIGGLGRVEVERITHADIRTGAWKLPSTQTADASTTNGPTPSKTPLQPKSRQTAMLEPTGFGE